MELPRAANFFISGMAGHFRACLQPWDVKELVGQTFLSVAPDDRQECLSHRSSPLYNYRARCAPGLPMAQHLWEKLQNRSETAAEKNLCIRKIHRGRRCAFERALRSALESRSDPLSSS